MRPTDPEIIKKVEISRKTYLKSNYKQILPEIQQRYILLKPECQLSNYFNKITEISNEKGYIERDTVYIFGSGPSIHKIRNQKYFIKRMCFGINYSFEIVEPMDYVFIGEIETYDKIKTIFNEHKIIIPMAMNYHKTSERKVLTNNKSIHYIAQDPLLALNQRDILLDKHAKIFCYSTTTHSAIHIAAYMGAKNIKLIGCDYRNYPDGKIHFKTKYGGSDYNDQKWGALSKHKIGDEWITKELLKYGVKVENMSRMF